MKKIAYIDADSFAYRYASGGEQKINWGDGIVSKQVDNLAEVVPALDDLFASWVDRFKLDDFKVALSCPSKECWRCDVLPTYKDTRIGVQKPDLLEGIKQYLRGKYDVYEAPRMEADDIVGAHGSMPVVNQRNLIISIDKDLKTVPCWLFNPKRDFKPKQIKKHDADYWHMYQTLTGDTVDGYKGCPGIGPVKARDILKVAADEVFKAEQRWLSVVWAFESKGLTEADALVQARVARIARYEDYDWKNGGIKLWEPPSV